MLTSEIAEVIDEAVETIVVDLSRNSNRQAEVEEVREAVRGVARQVAMRVRMETTYEGPLPPPWILERYARLYPDAPRILFQSFEKQGDHRRVMELASLENESRRSNWGLISLTIITILVIIACVYLVINGYWVVGLIIGVAMIFALLAANVFGSTQRRQERTERVKTMMRALTGRTDRPDQV